MSTNEMCGAEFPLRPGQALCAKPRGHEHGPDTDWKRDYHSNGLLRWRVDGANMRDDCDIPTAAAARALLCRFGITGSQRHAFAERMTDDPMGVADELAAEVVEAIRHADRVLATDGRADR